MCIGFGAVLMMASGVGLIVTPLLVARYEGSVNKADLFRDGDTGTRPEAQSRVRADGPLNILLAGVDTRPDKPDEAPHADSVMILHVPRTRDRAYLFSLARDTLVDIPAYAPAKFSGGRGKLAEAMAHGSLIPGKAPDPTSGFALLAQTVTHYTGIGDFAAGAIINFDGFRRIVDAMGGVDLYVDQRVVSIHVTPDGRSRYPTYENSPRTRPQKEYTVGPHHMVGWEALDYVRQRHIDPSNGLEGDDYARQRHQRQFIKAMVAKAASAGVVGNPARLDSVLLAAGGSLTFAGRGATVLDFAIALRKIDSGSLTTLKLLGSEVRCPDGSSCQRLDPIAQDLFAAVAGETVDSFLGGHTELISR